jgi:hypothetical protein
MKPMEILAVLKDPRAANRAQRRGAGIRGPVFRLSGPVAAPRYVRKHADAMSATLTTRRVRKQRARISRILSRRGL